LLTTRSVRTTLKRYIRIVLGERNFAKLSSGRSRRLQHRLVTQWGLPDITRRLIAECGQTVLRGPFKGLLYPADVLLERVGAPLLIGSYESELHPIFNSAPWHEYDCAVDVGCGEGYYAVGIAKVFGVHVIAFDTAAKERNRCDVLALLNGVSDKVATRDWIDPKTLSSICSGKRCFVLSDCEGYEINLFAPAILESLVQSDLLIETHDVAFPVTQSLTARLEATHDIEPIKAAPRNLANYPELAFLESDATAALREYRRDGQTWLWCRARSTTRSPNRG
jgi:hypothetical protein